MKKETQEKLSPDDAIQLLKDGNKRFLEDNLIKRNHNHKMLETSKQGQYPFAVILSCIDSRVPINLAFDQSIGDLFNIKIAGNIVNTDILGSMEYSCDVVGSKLIVVLSHTQCGAITAACKGKGANDPNLSTLLSKITPSIVRAKSKTTALEDTDLIEEVAIENVKESIAIIQKNSSILKEMEDSGKLKIVGASYDISNGMVTFH